MKNIIVILLLFIPFSAEPFSFRFNLFQNPVVTSGGIKVVTSQYTTHIFKSGSSFVTNKNLNNVEFIVVGGGGGGSGYVGGGGGGGGVIYQSGQNISSGTYPIVIGAGGAYRNIGGITTFKGYTAKGGGYGARGGNRGGNLTGSSGSSGGGGASSAGNNAGGSGTQGNNGGNSNNFSGVFGSGGGGAVEVLDRRYKLRSRNWWSRNSKSYRWIILWRWRWWFCLRSYRRCR